MNKEQVYADLAELLRESEAIETEKNISRDVPMKEYTSFKVGGPADILIEPENREMLVSVVRYLYENQIPYMIMGNGSNTLFRDAGYRGVVIIIGQNMSTIQVGDSGNVFAETGVLLSSLAKAVAKEGFTGMEFASGIPGSLGGAVFMNAGAYGGEMKDIITGATFYDPVADKRGIIGDWDMDLSYRHSIFQTNKMVVLDIFFELQKGDIDEIQNTMRELNEKRNSKQPVNIPSAGSFFKRPEGHFAGKLIQDAGLKGRKIGGAQISELHSGFIVNTGDATAADIEELMHLVQKTVYDKFEVELEPEVRIVGDSE